MKYFKVEGHNICNLNLHGSPKNWNMFTYIFIYYIEKNKVNIAKMLTVGNLCEESNLLFKEV